MSSRPTLRSPRRALTPSTLISSGSEVGLSRYLSKSLLSAEREELEEELFEGFEKNLCGCVCQ